MTSRASRSLSAAALCLPVTLWFTDCLYSTCRVRGTSMEPTLKDGDVLLVRKSDVLADYILTGTAEQDDETDRARLKRMEATMSGGTDHPIMSRPPLVLGGHVVVFCCTKKAFPHEYHVKRVAGVGGQLVRPNNRFRHIESIPPYSIWVEGDNAVNSEDSSDHGPVSKKLLVGRAERVIWPPSRWGKVTKVAPVEGKSWWP